MFLDLRFLDLGGFLDPILGFFHLDPVPPATLEEQGADIQINNRFILLPSSESISEVEIDSFSYLDPVTLEGLHVKVCHLLGGTVAVVEPPEELRVLRKRQALLVLV